jgi:hypothetical protein
MAAGARGSRSGRSRSWTELPHSKLLDLRLCDLQLEIEGTALEQRIARLHAELARRRLRFRPHVWLSTDWFTPDAVIGFAVPFFLAHPRLVRLEHREMLEAEGATNSWCLQLMRHETGHAIDNAYRLHLRKRWREVFGHYSVPYRSSYVPVPDSRNYVIHLDYWYGQSHPAEDFAETFAVWLEPRSHWRSHYAGWPALAKLEYVDEVMQEIADQAPAVRSRARPDALTRDTRTLREYYADKKRRYRDETPSPYDDQLTRIFARGGTGEGAASFLRRRRSALRRRVAQVTSQHPYLIDQVLNEIIPRCLLLGLRRRRSSEEAFLDVCILLATMTTSFSHGGHPEYRR